MYVQTEENIYVWFQLLLEQYMTALDDCSDLFMMKIISDTNIGRQMQLRDVQMNEKIYQKISHPEWSV